MDLNLQDIRAQLDGIDDRLTDLFAERMRLVAQVAAYKKEKGLPILDTGRERSIVNRLSLRSGEDLEGYTRQLYQTLFTVSRAYQAEKLYASSPFTEELARAAERIEDHLPRRVTVACQGTEGAYSQKFCDRTFEYPEILYVNTFNDVFNAVEKGVCPFGVLPIENSTAGSVTQVYDLMEKHRFHIVRAGRQKVDHALLAAPGTKMEEVRTVVSHEQALRQCAAFFSTHPEIEAVPMANTAVAASYVAKEGRRDLAAIASRDCEALYGLTALCPSVADQAHNFTRFICIAKDLTVYRGANKISLMLSISHQPGALYRLLGHVAAAGLNLTKLESRPIPGRDFEFRFFFDIQGSIEDFSVRAMLERLRNDTEQFVFLGNYGEMG